MVDISNVLAVIGSYGLEDRTASEVLNRTIPPKLAAGLVMTERAGDGVLNAAHMDALMTAYYGNNLPATIATQKSKFKLFIDCGVLGLPLSAVIHQAANMVDAAKATADACTDSKMRAKEIKAAEKMGGSIFEKACKLARAQKDKGQTMLTAEEIRAVLQSEKEPSVDPLGDELAALMETIGRLGVKHGGIDGLADVQNALGHVIAKHHRKRNAPIMPMPTPQVGNAQGNVVVMADRTAPAPVSAPAKVEVSSKVTPEVIELADLVEVG